MKSNLEESIKKASKEISDIVTGKVIPEMVVEHLGCGHSVVYMINKVNGERIDNSVSYEEAIKTAKAPKYSHKN